MLPRGGRVGEPVAVDPHLLLAGGAGARGDTREIILGESGDAIVVAGAHFILAVSPEARIEPRPAASRLVIIRKGCARDHGPVIPERGWRCARVQVQHSVVEVIHGDEDSVALGLESFKILGPEDSLDLVNAVVRPQFAPGARPIVVLVGDLSP